MLGHHVAPERRHVHVAQVGAHHARHMGEPEIVPGAHPVMVIDHVQGLFRTDHQVYAVPVQERGAAFRRHAPGDMDLLRDVVAAYRDLGGTQGIQRHHQLAAGAQLARLATHGRISSCSACARARSPEPPCRRHRRRRPLSRPPTRRLAGAVRAGDCPPR